MTYPDFQPAQCDPNPQTLPLEIDCSDSNREQEFRTALERYMADYRLHHATVNRKSGGGARRARSLSFARLLTAIPLHAAR
jgi:hypothetical protein